MKTIITVQYVKQINPLGTTDGQSYTIVPRA